MKKTLALFIISILLAAGFASCKPTTDNMKKNGIVNKEFEIPEAAVVKKPVSVLKSVKNLTLIAQLTGKDSINKTDRFGVYGTDLGSMIEMDGKIHMVFGDTFGLRSDSHRGAGGDNWRSNVMAVISDNDPSDGLTFDGMITDDNGTAKELLSSLKIDNDEMTVIPTGGFSANGSLYLNFMSVRHWGDPGKWDANFAGAAVSKDKGKSWTKLDQLCWPGDSNFIQVSACGINDEIYFWCIPSGRFGGVKLMKAPADGVENISSYVYFKGENSGKAQWSSNFSDAKEIVPAPVGELSVIWNKYLNRWIMTYLNENNAAIEIREGIEPWGPWGEPVTLVKSGEYPALYGAYMHPRYVEQDGRVVYFAMSQWNPYNVFWMRAELEK